MKISKLIMTLNPIFLKCSQLTDDVYWKGRFISASQNEFPKGIKYDIKSNTIYIRTVLSTNKIITDPVFLGTTTEETFKNFLDVFRDRLGVYSPLDNQAKKDIMNDFQKSKMSDLSKPWKDLKPRSLKELMIAKYVTNQKLKYDMNEKEAKIAYMTLQIALQLKQIAPEDIDYQNGEIKNINGLTISGKELKITKPLAFVSKKEKKLPQKKFDHAITAYINECKAKKV